MSTNHSLNQWVDLGVHTEACMTRPDTRGEAGGAISLWVNISDCTNSFGAFVTKVRDVKATGSAAFCRFTGNLG